MTICAEVRNPWLPRRPVINFLAYLLNLPQTLRRLRTLIHDLRIATVHIHFPDLHAVTWLLLRWHTNHSFRVILSFHGLDVKAALAARGLPRLGWRLLLRRSDQIVVCAQSLRDELVAAFPDGTSRICVIDNGVDVASVERAGCERPEIELPTDFILSLGTYEFKKGHDVLMLAFDRVASKNATISLVIIGRHEAAEYERLVRLREVLTHGRRILLLKEVPHAEAMRALARAQLFALASRAEPFGIAVLEAAVLLRPIVTTTVCGVARLLTPDADLLSVPPDDVPALTDAINRLLNDRALVRRLTAHARAQVVSRFDWNCVMERYHLSLGAAVSRYGEPHSASVA
jgi:glycosyltransferase involved in cell wall biosynthesis